MRRTSHLAERLHSDEAQLAGIHHTIGAVDALSVYERNTKLAERVKTALARRKQARAVEGGG